MANPKDVNFGAIGSSAPMQYWNDLVHTSSALVQQQSLRWTALFQEYVLGNGDPSHYVQAVGRLYAGYLQDAFVLGAFPWMWWGRFMGDIPSLCFIIDEVTEATSEQTVMTPFSIPQGAQVLVADLSRIGPGPGTSLKSEHVFVRVTNGGNSLVISLRNLKPFLPVGPPLNRASGLYVGLVYSSDLGTTAGSRPLALLNVFLQPSMLPEAPPTSTQG